MSTDQIVWKTNAWKDPNMVAGYARNVANTSGANMMKNRVETELFQKYAAGKSVLDVGVGTGRASIPLAELGFEVTGVDSSEAMLRKCRELAGKAPMQLIQGDVAKLPFADESFDTVMALNTIAHFPHWRQIVQEWARVARPGGRMIFDMFSMDHDTAYAAAIGKPAAWGISEFAPPSVEAYYLRLPVDELVQALDGMGLSVAAIVPYSVLCGTKGFNRFFDETPLSGFSWDRLLSWVAADRALFDFLVFLEQELIARLTSTTACRYMVVLDKVADQQKNRRWRDRNDAFNADLARGLRLASVEKYSDLDPAAFKAALGAQLAHPPNRYVLARMLLANLRWNWPIDLSEFIDEPYLAEISLVLQRGRLDADVTAMLQNVHAVPQTSADFAYKGIALGSTIEYNAMIAVLDHAFCAFDEPRTQGAPE